MARRKRPSWQQLLVPEDVARIFDVEPETVVDWARTGRLPGLRTPGGQWRFRQSDIKALGAPVEVSQPIHLEGGADDALR